MRYRLFGGVRRIVRIVRYTVVILETKNETPLANELRNMYIKEYLLSSNKYSILIFLRTIVIQPALQIF